MEAASQLLYLYPELVFCLDSSMVEHAAVNRGVAGSSPARGVLAAKSLLDSRLRGQAVKTSPFHGGNTGSIPVGVTTERYVTPFSVKLSVYSSI